MKLYQKEKNNDLKSSSLKQS